MLCRRKPRLVALELQDLLQVVLEPRHGPLQQLDQTDGESDFLGGEDVHLCVERVDGLRYARILRGQRLARELLRVAEVFLRLLADLLRKICYSYGYGYGYAGRRHEDGVRPGKTLDNRQ